METSLKKRSEPSRQPTTRLVPVGAFEIQHAKKLRFTYIDAVVK